MIRKKYPREWTKETILEIFHDLDHFFVAKKQKVEVLTLGGVSIVFQEFQQRSTNDIDLAPVRDEKVFSEACQRLGIPSQIITIVSTVDFNDVTTISLFKGRALHVLSVSAEHLVKLKLERFRRQDPEDIYAIMEKCGITYEQFLAWVQEGKGYFIGRKSEYILNARIVVENLFPTRVSDFNVQIKQMAP